MTRAPSIRAGLTRADLVSVLRAAWAMIEAPQNWRPIGRKGNCKSVVAAIIDASIDAGFDYRVPLVHLALQIGSGTHTGDVVEWGRCATHDQVRQAFASALQFLTSPEKEAA